MSKVDIAQVVDTVARTAKDQRLRDFTSLVLAWHVIMGMVIRRCRHQHDLIFRNTAGKIV